MVLPIIVGIGVTISAITIRSGLRAWDAYKRLTPLMIAQLNRVQVPYTASKKNYRSGLNQELQSRLNQYPGGFYSRMTETEALLILGISSEEIEHLNATMLKRKHRRAILQNHPDKGGSPYLAMKINEARETLERGIMVNKNE